MALIDVDILSNEETIVSDANADTGDTIDVNLLGSGTLVVDGVDGSVNSLVGVGVYDLTFAAQNGGSLTINQGLLDLDLLSSVTFEIRDNGTITLNASLLDVGLLDTLNTFTVNYTGDASTGTFIYDPPPLSLLQVVPQTIVVQDMGPTDRLVIDGRSNLQVVGYANGTLTLQSQGSLLLGETVVVEIPMTQAEYDVYAASPSTYLIGDTFIFPGTLICFTKGTRILTTQGEVAVEKLQVGDLVLTVDHGPQAIRWIGQRSLSAGGLAAVPHLRPIQIEPDALGPGVPNQRLSVSPQHRCLVRSRIAERIAGEAEVLVAAKHLIGTPGIAEARPGNGVIHFHMLFDRHELVWSNGAVTESFYLGKMALGGIDHAARQEILELFPELAQRSSPERPLPVRPFLRGRLARKLVERTQANGKPLVEPQAKAKA